MDDLKYKTEYVNEKYDAPLDLLALAELTGCPNNAGSSGGGSQASGGTTTIAVHEVFTAVTFPLTYSGYISGTITYTITGDTITIDVALTVQLDAEGSSPFVGVEVSVDGDPTRIRMGNPDYPVLIPVNSRFMVGSITITNITPETSVTIEVNANAWTNDPNPGGPTYYRIIPLGWEYVIQ